MIRMLMLARVHPPPPLEKIGEREVCVMPTLIVFYTAGGFPGMSGENF